MHLNRVLINVEQSHPPPLASELLGGGKADALGSTCNEYRFYFLLHLGAYDRH